MMKRFFLIVLALLCLGVSPYIPQYEAYMPVFMSRQTLEQSVKYVAGATPMIHTGKIYYRSPYIYVNERYKGVHIINNTNPYHPVNEGFVIAPGCIDMAVKGNILYIDNSVDLVSFDLESKVVTKRIRDVFPEPLPPESLFRQLFFDRPQGYVVVEWKKTNL
jgi:hypothetical protein